MFKTLVIFALIAAPAVAQPAQPRFAIGQVWTVKEPAAETLRVTIGRIESIKSRRVISVRITGIPCPADMACKTTEIGHAPFTEEVLRASLDTVASPQGIVGRDFRAGYAQWKEAKGGVFTISPAEVAVVMLQTLRDAGQSAVDEAR